MGLCAQLCRNILNSSVFTHQKKKEKCKHHIEWIKPMTDVAKVFNETEVLLFDMTQMFFFSGKSLAKENTEIHVYETMRQMLDKEDSSSSSSRSSSLIIGELEIGEDHVTNCIQTFSMDDLVRALGGRIFDIIDKFKTAAKQHKKENILKYVFLCLDGDGPNAKKTTRKRRSASGFKSYLRRKLSGTTRNSLSEDDIQRILEKTKEEVLVPNKLFRGSMARFMTKRCNQILIAEAFAELLISVSNPIVDNISLYLVVGATKMRNCTNVGKLSGRFHHPNEEKFCNLPPYQEADSLIPLLWSCMRTDKMGCIVSKDSDMLLTLLAMSDEKLLLLYPMDHHQILQVSPIFCNQIAFAIQPCAGLQKMKQLETLLHLTMGGNDYVEGFPRVGCETLMYGLDVLRSHPKHSFFPSVTFAPWSRLGHLLLKGKEEEDSEKPMSFQICDLAESTVAANLYSSAIQETNDLYPVRLGTSVYFVAFDSSMTEESLAWYCKKCPENLEKVPTFLQKRMMTHDSMKTGFVQSMRRRLYSLSLLTEARAPSSWISLSDVHLAMKSGYNAREDYEYDKVMSFQNEK